MFELSLACLLLTAAFVDARSRTIPPILPLLILALAPLNPEWQFYSALAGAAVCGGTLLAADFVQTGAFGGGDIKLLTACGYTLGYAASLTGLFLAMALSLVPCLYYHFTKKQTHIAFAPYIAAGFLLAIV